MTPQDLIAVVKSGMQGDFWKLLKEKLEAQVEGLSGLLSQPLSGDQTIRIASAFSTSKWLLALPENLVKQAEDYMRQEEESKKHENAADTVPPTVGGDVA